MSGCNDKLSLLANGLKNIQISPESGNKTRSELDEYMRIKEIAEGEAAKKIELEQLKRQAASKPLKNFRRGIVSPEITKQVQSLPIFKKKKEFLDLVANNQILIVVGETGSGKSTQIPQFLADSDYGERGRICCTQPRRVAAKSLAVRVSRECGVALGTMVGFAVRFDQCYSQQTVIKYMTDGLLVKEFSNDSKLESYSVIIIDEAHERSISSDVCFGLLKRVASYRKDLRIIIASATLDSKKFSQYFNNAPVLGISGHSFPVEIIFEPFVHEPYDYIQGAVDKVLRIHQYEPKGDVLVFLSGQDEIERMWEMLDRNANIRKIYDYTVCPCHGTMPLEEQNMIFEPTTDGSRKIVLATNIAETSITIDGIVYVIDCGYFKQKEYNPRTGIESLVNLRITEAQAIQREGRAGRTCPGKAYKLYTKYTFTNLRKSQIPEIQRSNVESTCLDLISMGVDDLLKFDFMDPPTKESIFEALVHLQELGALDRSNCLTNLGRIIVQFPLDPPLAKTLIESAKLGCSEEMVTIVSVLSTQHQNLFNRNKKVRDMSDMRKAQFAHQDGDHLTFLKIYNAWEDTGFDEGWCKENFMQYKIMTEAREIREQLCGILTKNRFPIVFSGINQMNQKIKKALVAGYFRRVAFKSSKYIYNTFTISADGKDRSAVIHPSSVLQKSHGTALPQWLLYHDICITTRTFMRDCIAIQPEWVKEYAPEFVIRMAKIFPEMAQI